MWPMHRISDYDELFGGRENDAARKNKLAVQRVAAVKKDSQVKEGCPSEAGATHGRSWIEAGGVYQGRE